MDYERSAQIALDVLKQDVSVEADRDFERMRRSAKFTLERETYGSRTGEVHEAARDYLARIDAEIARREALSQGPVFEVGQRVRMIAIQPGPGAAGCSGLFDPTSLGTIGTVVGANDMISAAPSGRIAVRIDMRDLGYGDSGDDLDTEDEDYDIDYDDNFKVFYLYPGIFEAVEEESTC